MEKRLLELGFDTLGSFLDQRRGVGVVRLAEEMGSAFVGVDLARAILEQAHRKGPAALRAAARDLLARHLREILVAGWGRPRPDELAGIDADTINYSAVGTWQVQVAATNRTLRAATQAVAEALDKVAPEGWLPAGADDPVLVSAFDRGWPAPRSR